MKRGREREREGEKERKDKDNAQRELKILPANSSRRKNYFILYVYVCVYVFICIVKDEERKEWEGLINLQTFLNLHFKISFKNFKKKKNFS